MKYAVHVFQMYFTHHQEKSFHASRTVVEQLSVDNLNSLEIMVEKVTS